MPSKIEELIAEFRAVRANYRASSALSVYTSERAYAYEMCAQKLERAYCEEVVPLVSALREARIFITDYATRNPKWGHEGEIMDPCGVNFVLECVEDILRRFDAPAGITCPGCSEQIGLDDSVCRHCGAILQPSKIHEEPKQ